MHVIVKGLKGDFNPVTDWYKEILANSDQLMKIIDNQDEGWATAKKLLDIFKAGLYSKNPDVVLWACKLLSKCATDLHTKGYSGEVWDWFVGSTASGLQGILHSIEKNHTIAIEGAISVMCQFGKYNYSELFTHYLKLCFSNIRDYFRIVSTFIQPLSEYKTSKDEIISAGILFYWIDLACKKADMDIVGTNKPEDRAAALGLLMEIWIYFPNVVEEKAEYADYIIKLAQRANRDKSDILQYVSLVLLFKLLDIFAAEKNPYGPIVYKTLTFALVENHQKAQIRQLILDNFTLVFDSFPSIPVSIVIEPFIKQVCSLNLFL